MRPPLVSVVLPTYNSGKYLAPAVDSILTQTYNDLELLLIDDGSTDESVERLVASVYDERLRVVRQENQGLAASLNYGIDLARGHYILRMDGDDVAHAGRIAMQLKCMSENTSLAAVGTQIIRVVGSRPTNQTNFPLKNDEIVDGLLKRRHVICHPTTMFKKSDAQSIGGYWTQGLAEDWDFFLRLSEKGDIENLPDALLSYRYHENGINAASMLEVRTNMRLAVLNYRNAREGKPEVSGDDYKSAMSFFEKTSLNLEVSAMQHYRKYLALRSEDPMRAWWHASLAACMQPGLAIGRVAVKRRDTPKQLKMTRPSS